MKTKTLLLTLALCVTAGTACLANPHVGTWKLNEAKSTLTPGMGKNTLVVYEAAMGVVKVTVDGVDADGKPMHTEWTGNYDGKFYPVSGDPTSDMRSYKKIDGRTMDFRVKKDGKVVVNGRVLLAADGKSRTVTTSGMNAKGEKFENIAFYDKQ